MRRNLGASGDLGTVEPATRIQRPGWRDLRLWVGVAIVVGCVVVGARLVAAADDTVAVWSATTDLAPGAEVDADDLTLVHVGLDEATLAGYFADDDTLPAGAVLTSRVTAGDLLPRSALDAPGAADLATVPLAVAPENLPPDTHAGSVVDVYAVGRRSRPALTGVGVVSVAGPDSGLGATLTRQVVVAVPSAQVPEFFSLLAGDQTPVLTVVGRG